MERILARFDPVDFTHLTSVLDLEEAMFYLGTRSLNSKMDELKEDTD